MNSFNHYSLGSCGEWLFDTVAGIDMDPAHPGFKRIVIRPDVNGPLTWVHAHHDCPYGRIESNWTREGDSLTLLVTIPPNTTATVQVPTSDAKMVTEGGKSAAQAPGVRFIRSDNGSAVYEVGSGTYAFKSPIGNGARLAAVR